GQISAALVGGVNLLLAPQSFVGFSRASMLSPQGRCHAFDARANGYVRSEGGGFVLLMRQDAAAGHRTRALIRGTGTNSDGRTTGFSQPNRVAQAAMLHSIYDRFDIDPDELTYVEAHGTGTPVGDPIEAAALGEVLGTRRRDSLPIGSVKTNLGHLEAASGMAGLMKALLIIENRQLPRSLHCETPNPAIPLNELNLRLLPHGEAVGDAGPITIGINSFGFGGTNAHAVLSSAPAAPGMHRADAAQPPMLLLSARSTTGLNEQASRWHDEIAAHGDTGLPVLLAGAARFREQHPHRLAIIASDAESYRRGLADFVAGAERNTIVRGEAVANDQVAFIHSGNGSQWPGMAAQAMQMNPAFRAFIGEASDALQPHLGWSVVDRLAAAPDAERLRLTEEAQPQLFAIQYATTSVLRQIGVTACAHLGHSVGEIAAAWGTGALTLEDAARVVAARSRYQGAMAGEGGMAVLIATPDEVEAGIAAIGATGLAIAAINTERSLTVAGPVQELQALKEYAAAHRWTFELLDLPYAFHSPLMDPIRAPLLADLDGLIARPTQSTFVSTVTGTMLPGQRLGADYWWRNVREPVSFAAGVERLLESGIRIFVEIGPQPVLQGYLNKLVATEGVRGRVLPSLVRRPMPADPLLVCAARCHVAGHSIAETVGGVSQAALDGLPHYPWQREDLRVERTSEATDLLNPSQTHPLLGFQSSDEGRNWTSDLSAVRLPWLADHQVSRSPVLPAAAFIEIALAAARTTAAPGATLELRDLDIGSPLVLPPGATQTLRTSLGIDGKLTLASRQRLADGSWATHARCRASESGSDKPLPWSGSDPSAAQRTISAAELYDLTDQLGLHYGPAFQTVASVDVLGPRDASVHLRQTVSAGPNEIVHPSLLDGAFQGLVGLASSLLRLDEEAGGVLPWRFERVRSFRPGTATGARLHVRHVGPRAICADILVHDAGEDALLELNGCWFVRTNAAPVRNPASHCVHQIAVATSGDAPGAPATMHPAIEAQPPGLADVYISAAIQEALLARGGDLPASTANVLTWLREDGLLDGAALQSELGGIHSDDLIGAIAFEHPTAVADAALLSLAAQRFRSGLGGQAQSTALPPALLDQMLTASPTAASCLQAMRAAVVEAVAGRPGLRILEIGTGRGTLAADLLPALSGAPPADYCMLASPDEIPVLRETMAHLHASRTVARPGTDAALAGPFDVIVGINALTLMGQAERDSLLARLPDLLCPPSSGVGGTLLLLEPQPNRLWTFLPVPDAAEQPAVPRIGSEWISALRSAGLPAIEASSVPGLHWASTLLRGKAAQPAAARGAGLGRLLLLAAPGDAVADALANLLDIRRIAPDRPLASADLDGLSGLIVMPPPRLTERDAPLW
ncbi:MAG: acyltransferase domain-containing protein, partial [Pseudomonadota bacterium]|nr:acyltransferase domain-containing protein [Pseudomonadota bacterium]